MKSKTKSKAKYNTSNAKELKGLLKGLSLDKINSSTDKTKLAQIRKLWYSKKTDKSKLTENQKKLARAAEARRKKLERVEKKKELSKDLENNIETLHDLTQKLNHERYARKLLVDAEQTPAVKRQIKEVDDRIKSLEKSLLIGISETRNVISNNFKSQVEKKKALYRGIIIDASILTGDVEAQLSEILDIIEENTEGTFMSNHSSQALDRLNDIYRKLEELGGVYSDDSTPPGIKAEISNLISDILDMILSISSSNRYINSEGVSEIYDVITQFKSNAGDDIPVDSLKDNVSDGTYEEQQTYLANAYVK